MTVGATFLLVIDVQRDFCAGGALAVPHGDAVVPVINRIAAAYEHIVLTQDWHPAGHRSFASQHAGKAPFQTIETPYGVQTLWPDHCVQDSAGAQFHPDLALGRAELILRKGFRAAIDSYSAFFENDRTTPTGLGGWLRERGCRRIALVGLALDYCVRYSAEDGHRLGFEVTVLEDACRAIDPAGTGAETLARCRALGIAIERSDAQLQL